MIRSLLYKIQFYSTHRLLKHFSWSWREYFKENHFCWVKLVIIYICIYSLEWLNVCIIIFSHKPYFSLYVSSTTLKWNQSNGCLEEISLSNKVYTTNLMYRDIKFDVTLITMLRIMFIKLKIKRYLFSLQHIRRKEVLESICKT